MSDDDAEARRKRAAALRKQVADLTGGQRGKAAEPDDAAEEDEVARRDAPRVYTTQGGNLGDETSKGAAGGEGLPLGRSSGTAEPNETTEEGGSARRDAPRVHPPSPREFIAQRMRELGRKRDDNDTGK